MPPMPISFMVSVGRGRSGGTGAVIPRRGANVARAIPERSIVSATKVNALSSVGWIMTSRSEEHTSELQSLMRNSYAVFCLKTKIDTHLSFLLLYKKLKI